MSSLQFACPYCEALFEVDLELAGQDAMCPACSGVVTIPGPEEFPAEEPVAADGPSFECPHCAGMFQVEPEMLGQQVLCPLCEGVVELATADDGAVEVETPAVEAPSGPPLRPEDFQRQREQEELKQLTAEAPKPEKTKPPEKTGPYAFEEPVKTVTEGGKTRELRRLTPEEKAERRKRQNLILGVGGILLLALTLGLLLWLR